MCSFDKSFDVSSLQRARREKGAVGGGSKPVYNYNPWAPEPHLFSATFNVTSTANQFILTASSSAGMAAIRDVVSSAIATAMDNDTYTSTPKNVQIVSNNMSNSVEMPVTNSVLIIWQLAPPIKHRAMPSLDREEILDLPAASALSIPKSVSASQHF